MKSHAHTAGSPRHPLPVLVGRADFVWVPTSPTRDLRVNPNLSKRVALHQGLSLILTIEANKQHFWHIMLYYFKKGKNETEMKKKKDLCSAGRRCRVWLNVSKVVCKVSCCRLLAGQCSTVGQTGWSWRRSDWDINWEQSTLYHVGDGRHTQISKSIKLLVKMKKVSFILWKKTKWPF